MLPGGAHNVPRSRRCDNRAVALTSKFDLRDGHVGVGATAAERGEMTEAIGWISSLVLVCTIAKQIYKQWHEGTSKGVSRWLFIGQMIASGGFTLYSALVKNWVFVVTNALMLIGATVGYAIVIHHQRSSSTSPRVREPRALHGR